VDLFRNETDFETYAAGQTVFRAGDPAQAMYVVLEGEVDLHVKDKLVETVGSGGVLGEMALIDRAPRIATATARTACKLVPISEKRFLFMVQQTPHFALQIMKILAERLRRMDEKL
jgi:CRP-like cAMP-binding protein